MANSRIMLVCRHCGEQISIGKGDFGSYVASVTEDRLGEFFAKHCRGECISDNGDFSENARDHFAILEKGECLEMLGTEIKRGQWSLPFVIEGEAIYQCTNCHAKTTFQTKYCPECGARMT